MAAAAAGGLTLTVALAQPQPQQRNAVAAPTARAAPTTRGDRIVYPAHNPPTFRLPNGDRRPVRSLLNVARPLHYGDFVWNERGVPDGPVWVRVDLARQTMSVFRSGHEIGTAVMLYGTDGKPTPTGLFPILEKARHHRSTLYDAEMPYMLRLTGDGVAIHASKVRRGAATHGCVGVPAAFAERLFTHVRRGDVVLIV
jgi:lipoprotein-anchoring transpeptidase ErfK/SrfK